jgi:CubicO group peptidase (beta-lactamase class C family)
MRTIFCRVAFLIAFTLFYHTFLFSQKTVQGLDDFLKALQAGSKLPGFAVAIVKNDQVLFSKGYGFADKKKKLPYTPETIQPTGGISTTFTGLALMQGIEKGWFTLETPVNDILPFKIVNPNAPDAIIRIKHLAAHTSGLVDNKDTYRSVYAATKKPGLALKDFLKAYYVAGGSYYNTGNFSNNLPGKQYAYSRIGASLAAYIVEIKSGKPFADYCAVNIFAPLKMNDSHWFFDESKSPKYATLYEVNRQDDPMYKQLLNADGTLKPYSSASYPDGSLKTSLNDLTKYLVAMIKGYSGQPGLISKASFQTLFKKQFTPAEMPVSIDAREPNRAVFWSYNRKGKIGHTGNDPGIAAFISFDPVTKVGRVLLINTQLEGADNITTIEAFVNLTRSLDTFEAGK